MQRIQHILHSFRIYFLTICIQSSRVAGHRFITLVGHLDAHLARLVLAKLTWSDDLGLEVIDENVLHHDVVQVQRIGLDTDFASEAHDDVRQGGILLERYRLSAPLVVVVLSERLVVKRIEAVHRAVRFLNLHGQFHV